MRSILLVLAPLAATVAIGCTVETTTQPAPATAAAPPPTVVVVEAKPAPAPAPVATAAPAPVATAAPAPVVAVAPPAVDSEELKSAHGTNFTIHSALDTSFCFDAEGDVAKDGTRVFIYKCHGRENQRWTITDAVGGHSAFLGIGGLCLDVSGFGKKDGTTLQLWRCHFGGNQTFKVEHDAAKGWGHIKEVGTGKCVATIAAVDKSPLVIETCREDAIGQRWHLQK
ncbi:MAG: RICIN domain-containing protein [Polyangiales bacterium]